MTFMEMAYDKGLGEEYEKYMSECERLERQYPDHGETYNRKMNELKEEYFELFEDDEEGYSIDGQKIEL